MSKKILSVVLALVLVMSTFALSAFAASKPAYEEDPSEYTQAWKLEDASVGDVYKANIYLKAEYGVGAVQFKIESAGKADLVAVDSDVFVGDYDINFSKEGLVFIVPTPAEGTESMDAIEFADETLIATLTFELAEGADSATVSIENAPKNEENPDGTLLAARVDDGNLVTGTSIVGQTVLAVAGSATFGAAVVNTLVIKNSQIKFSDAYCNTAYKGILCGFVNFGTAAGLTKDNLTTTLGDEYLNVVANEKNKYSTGTVIQVLAADKTTVLEEYVVVVFGDVNYDGVVNLQDAKLIANSFRTMTGNKQSPLKVAGNCNGDTSCAVNLADGKLLAGSFRTFKNKQAEIAESVF